MSIDSRGGLKCMDVGKWRAYKPEEPRDHVERVYSSARDGKSRQSRFKSSLVVRTHLSPVDTYCYLKARFGDPNGFQTFLRKDDSDKFIHWDFNLKAESEDVYLAGTHREVHMMLSESMEDSDWRDLICSDQI